MPAGAVRLQRIADLRTSFLSGAGLEGVAEVLEANVDTFVCVLGLRAAAPGRAQ